MELVEFSPVGIAKKEHELYGLDDAALRAETAFLRSDIISWSLGHFRLSDQQLSWMHEQDDRFRIGFANDVASALENRWDIDFLNEFPEKDPWSSKIVDAKKEDSARRLTIHVHKEDL